MELSSVRVAFIVGINEYEAEEIKNLDKAVNDAVAVAEKLEKFGFKIITGYDITAYKFDELKEEYQSLLKDAEVGLFYFAGHGIEIDGENILLTNDSQIGTGRLDTVKRTSIILQDLIDDFHPICQANIFIVDACREVKNELTRGNDTANIAPIKAPQGTLIAFSTSPGEKAGEGKVETPNSNYTTALLKHLEEPGIEIERFFKKVRITLHHMTNGDQTSWEHTSLIGNLILNPNVQYPNSENPYSATAIADSKWGDPNIADLLDGFQSHNYYSQNPALEAFKDRTDYTPDQAFVLGRNILQSALGGAWKCEEFLKSISSIKRYNDLEENNHVLNGILFEIYFDNNGQFRGHNLKTDDLCWLTKIIRDGRFVKSIEFINNQLRPYSNRLLYIPSPNLDTIEIKIFGKNVSEDFLKKLFMETYRISDILVNDQPILTENRADALPNSMYMRRDTVENFQNWLAAQYGIPFDIIKWIYIEEIKPQASVDLEKSLKII